MDLEKELKLLRESWTETFDQLFVLYEVAREVSSVIDLDSILDHVVNHASLLLETEGACVLLLNHETGQLELRVVKNEKTPEAKKSGIKIKIGEGVAGEAANLGKPVIFAKEPGEKNFKPDSIIFDVRSPRNVMCIPITLRGGETIGVIEVINKKNGTFTSKDRDFLMAIANISALSIENAKVYKQLKGTEIYQAQVIENLPEGFLALNVSGKLTHINSCAKNMLELKGNDDPTGSVYSEVLKEEPELIGHVEAALFYGRTSKWREISLKKSGKTVFLFTFVFRRPDNSILGAGVVLQDLVLKRG